MELSDLFDLADRENVQIISRPLPDGLRGFYYNDPHLPHPFIVLHHAVYHSEIELKTVLAEELGHHFTTGRTDFTVACNYTGRVNLSRAEHRALRWAVRALLPMDVFIAAFRDGLRVDEVAARFGVMETLVSFRARMLGVEGALHIKSI